MFNMFSKYTLNKEQSEIAKVVIEQRILDVKSLKKALDNHIGTIQSSDLILFELYRSEASRLHYLQKGLCSENSKEIQQVNIQLSKHDLDPINTNLELIDYSCDNAYLTMINYLDIMEDLDRALDNNTKNKFPEHFSEEQSASRLFIHDKLLKPFLALRTNYNIEKLELILYLYHCNIDKKIQLTKDFLALKEKEDIDGIFDEMPYKMTNCFGHFYHNNLSELHNTNIEIYGNTPEELSENFRKIAQHLCTEDSSSIFRYF